MNECENVIYEYVLKHTYIDCTDNKEQLISEIRQYVDDHEIGHFNQQQAIRYMTRFDHLQPEDLIEYFFNYSTIIKLNGLKLYIKSCKKVKDKERIIKTFNSYISQLVLVNDQFRQSELKEITDILILK